MKKTYIATCRIERRVGSAKNSKAEITAKGEKIDLTDDEFDDLPAGSVVEPEGEAAEVLDEPQAEEPKKPAKKGGKKAAKKPAEKTEEPKANEGTDGEGTDGTDGEATDGEGTDGEATDGEGTDGEATDGTDSNEDASIL